MGYFKKIWRDNPNRLVPLDFSHPFVKNMVAAYTFSDGYKDGIINLVNGDIASNEDPSIVLREYDGKGRKTHFNNPTGTGAMAGYDVGDPDYLKLSSEITIIHGARPKGTQTDNFGRVLSKTNGGSGDFYGTVFSAFDRQTGWRINNNTLYSPYQGLIADEYYDFAYTYKSGDRKIWIDGNIEAQDSLSGPISTSGNVKIGNHGSAQSRSFRGDVYYLYVFDEVPPDDQIILLNENPWQVLKPRRVWIPSIAVSNTELSGASDAKASAAALFKADVPIVSASLSVSSAQGAMSLQLPVSAVSSSITEAGGVLSVSVQVSAQTLANSLFSAGLDLSASMQGSAGAQSDANANLAANVGSAELSGASQSISAANALITINATLSGSALSESLAGANLISGQIISGSAKAKSSGSGVLVSDVSLSGSAKSFVNAQSGLSVIVPVTAGAASASNAFGGLNVSTQFTGAAISSALAQADISADQAASLAGSMQSDSFSNGFISLQVPLSVSVLCSTRVVAALSEDVSNIPWIDRWGVVANDRDYHKTADLRRYLVCA